LSSSSDDISGRQNTIKKHVQLVLPFEDLIAGPISAMITAQSYSAHATYQYITSLMDNSDDNALSPKILEIITSKMVQSSDDDDKDNSKEDDNTHIGFVEQKQLLKVPLLSLLHVPYISIDEAEIRFNADIIHHEMQKDTTDYKEEIKYGRKKVPFFTEPAKMHATFVSSNKSTNDIKSHISVKIKVKQHELPLGLEKYLQILGNSITVKDIK